METMPTAAGQARADQAVDELLRALPRGDRALLLDTRFELKDFPSPEELSGMPPDGLLFGLFTSPPPKVTVYEQPIAQMHFDIADVVWHEAGHRLGYIHNEPDGGSAQAVQSGQEFRMRMLAGERILERCGLVSGRLGFSFG